MVVFFTCAFVCLLLFVFYVNIVMKILTNDIETPGSIKQILAFLSEVIKCKKLDSSFLMTHADMQNLSQFMRLFIFLRLRYTAFSELLPLLAASSIPYVRVEKIIQSIDTSSSTIENSITISSPVSSLSFSAIASFEVRSPSRIQVTYAILIHIRMTNKTKKLN